MSTVYDDEELFQLTTFVFNVVTTQNNRDERGLVKTTGQSIPVKFKIKPQGGNSEAREQGSFSTENYKCNCVDPIVLPKEIKVGDIGLGIINGRACTCRVTSIGQSGVSPLTVEILGEKVTLQVTYNTHGGIKSV
ncbi:MAG: hypothetical protein KME30_17145 [Iphinoe sp. HA4291-MV1]|jgi:hypothetical protein|nr:hypothetical protein [Iphinoe sp. HA4291-MV1]